ncbi:hypothetical protein HC891_12150 [Candidatus Gracilibacteria bacterium]|nr:hypothetical protein [Candidatus Gracilibacteria bacterium]
MNSEKFRIQDVNQSHLEEVARWVFEKQLATGKTVIGESRNLRKLSEIVADKRSLAALRETKALESAFLLTKAPREAFTELLHQSKSLLLAAQGQLHLVKVTKSDEEVLREMADLLKAMRLVALQRMDELD